MTPIVDVTIRKGPKSSGAAWPNCGIVELTEILILKCWCAIVPLNKEEMPLQYLRSSTGKCSCTVQLC